MSEIDYKWIAQKTSDYLTIHLGGMTLTETLLINDFSEYLQLKMVEEK